MKTALTRSILVVAATLALASSTFASQPHMDQAIADLQAAKAQLQQASHNKGGWRVQAIRDIDKVISDIQNGKADAR